MWSCRNTFFNNDDLCSVFSSSWDEHVFELVLPKACMVGHVDFKFVLNANIVNIPQIQVTLLKNKAPGLGKVSGEDIVFIQLMIAFNQQCFRLKQLSFGGKFSSFLIQLVCILFLLDRTDFIHLSITPYHFNRNSCGQADLVPSFQCPSCKWGEKWPTCNARLHRGHPVHGHRGDIRSNILGSLNL